MLRHHQRHRYTIRPRVRIWVAHEEVQKNRSRERGQSSAAALCEVIANDLSAKAALPPILVFGQRRSISCGGLGVNNASPRRCCGGAGHVRAARANCGVADEHGSGVGQAARGNEEERGQWPGRRQLVEGGSRS